MDGAGVPGNNRLVGPFRFPVVKFRTLAMSVLGMEYGEESSSEVFFPSFCPCGSTNNCLIVLLNKQLLPYQCYNWYEPNCQINDYKN